MNNATEKKGPDHSTRSNNKRLPGIRTPGPAPSGGPKVKITKAPATGTAGVPPASSKPS